MYLKYYGSFSNDDEEEDLDINILISKESSEVINKMSKKIKRTDIDEFIEQTIQNRKTELAFQKK